MEERAQRFDYFSEFLRALPLEETEAETKNEINYLNKRMFTVSKKMKEARETLTQLQKEFTFYANYKYALEKTVTPLTLVTSPSLRKRKKEKTQSLLEKLEALSPEKQEKLIKLIKKENKREK